MSHNDDQRDLKIRCDGTLHDRLKRAAERSLRSMNCEAIHRLQRSFDTERAGYRTKTDSEVTA